jgi:hypothetical protein
MILHDALGVVAPAFFSVPCLARYCIIFYAHSARGKVCVGLVLWGASRKHPRSRRTTRVQRLDHMSLKCRIDFGPFSRK